MIRGSVGAACDRWHMANEWMLHCADCTREQVFASVECVDGHRPDCPEFACTGCGAAVFIGVVPPAAAPSPARMPDAA